MIYAIYWTADAKGKPRTRSEKVCNRIEADSPTDAVTRFLSGLDRDAMKYYQKRTLVAEPVTTRKGAA